mgnify:CR=1 FL=1
MWKNYLVTAVRNLLQNRISATVEIFGLGFALAATLLIGAWVWHEMSYEKWIPDHERVHTVQTTLQLSPERSNVVTAAPDFLKGLLADSVEGVAFAGRLGRSETRLKQDGTDAGIDLHRADQELLDIIQPKLLEGSHADALSRPDALVLTRQAADRLAGPGQQAIGLQIRDSDDAMREVTAVIADLPRATHIDFEALIPYPKPNSSVAQGGLQQMFMISDALYLRLSPGADLTSVQTSLSARIQEHFAQRFGNAGAVLQNFPITFDLLPVSETHLVNASSAGATNKGSIGMVLASGGVGLAILGMALINYAGLSLSRAISRRREIGLRQTLGAERGQLTVQFLIESLLTGILALAIGYVVAHSLIPAFAALMDRPLTVDDLYRPYFLASAIGIGLTATLAGGAYPAAVAGRNCPTAMTQSPQSGAGRNWFRSALVVAQYAITIALISGVVIYAMQMQLANQRMAQFDAGNIQLIRQQPGLSFAKMKILGERLAGQPGISGIAYGTTSPGMRNIMNRTYQSPRHDAPISVESYTVSPGYFELLGITPTAGLNFSAAARNGSTANTPRRAILNEAAVTQLGYSAPNDALGTLLRVPSTDTNGASTDAYQIIGVIPDVNFNTIHAAVRPTVFVSGEPEFVDEALSSQPNLPNSTLMLVALDPGNPDSGLASLKTAQEQIIPEISLNNLFLNQMLMNRYEGDLKRRDLLTWAAGLAILIAAMGLYARADQAATARTREIALRKVMGARIPQILRLMLWQFTRPVILANLIAWPVAGWFALRWLEGFADRIDLTPWPFLLAGLAALGIALVTVAGHALSVARTHPALALREE